MANQNKRKRLLLGEKIEAEEVDTDEVVTSRDFPSVSEIHALFEPLRNHAYDCIVPDANVGLRRVLNEFLTAIQEANAEKTDQVLTAKFFSSALPNSADSHSCLFKHCVWGWHYVIGPNVSSISVNSQSLCKIIVCLALNHFVQY